MTSLIVIITLIFLLAGIGYGRGAGTLTTQHRRHQRHHQDVGRRSPACCSCCS